MKRIYIAGKFEARDRLRPYAEILLGQGHRVLSSWLFAPVKTAAKPADLKGEAERDVEEVQEANLLIVDTLDENARGGREVEVGVALAGGVDVWVVGPKRNIFHELADEHFPERDGWERVLEILGDDE